METSLTTSVARCLQICSERFHKLLTWLQREFKGWTILLWLVAAAKRTVQRSGVKATCTIIIMVELSSWILRTRILKPEYITNVLSSASVLESAQNVGVVHNKPVTPTKLGPRPTLHSLAVVITFRSSCVRLRSECTKCPLCWWSFYSSLRVLWNLPHSLVLRYTVTW